MTVMTDCILGTGHRSAFGYTRSTLNGVRDYGHRNAYRQHVGPIPAGCEIDHLCKNPSCVNPEHLEAVPHRTNLMRGESFSARNARKTECSKGHPLTEDNLYRLSTRSDRICRTCRLAADVRYKARKRAK